MYERTTANARPSGRRDPGACRPPRTGRTSRASPSPRAAPCSRAPRAVAARRRAPTRTARPRRSSSRPRLKPRPGHAERLVLVRVLRVDAREGRLRDAPRRARRLAVVDVRLHHEARRSGRAASPRWLRISSEGIRYSNIVPPHDRSSGRAGHLGHRAAERGPVRLRHVALHDGEVAGEPRLRGQQIVVVRVELVLA